LGKGRDSREYIEIRFRPLFPYPDTNEKGERAFGALVSAIEQCQAAGILQQGNSRMLALVYLGVAIGIAKLAI
jgi:hypothetical protein